MLLDPRRSSPSSVVVPVNGTSDVESQSSSSVVVPASRDLPSSDHVGGRCLVGVDANVDRRMAARRMSIKDGRRCVYDLQWNRHSPLEVLHGQLHAVLPVNRS